MKSKIISLILVAIICVGLLSGCSQMTPEKLHTKITAAIEKDIAVLQTAMPMDSLTASMVKGSLSVKAPIDGEDVQYTMYQDTDKNAYMTVGNTDGNKWSWQLSDGNLIFTSNTFSKSAYGIDLKNVDNVAISGLPDALGITGEQFKTRYGTRIEGLKSPQESYAIRNEYEWFSFVSGKIAEPAYVEKTNLDQNGKNREVYLATYEIPYESVAAIWGEIYNSVRSMGESRYEEYLNAIFAELLTAQGCMLPEEKISEIQMLILSAVKQIDFFLENVKPGAVMLVYYDDDAKSVEQVDVFVQGKDGTELVKFNLHFEKEQNSGHNTYRVCLDVDGQNAVYNDKTIAATIELTDNKAHILKSRQISFTDSTGVVQESSVFEYKKMEGEYIWQTNMYSQPVTLTGTINAYDKSVRMTVDSFTDAEQVYELELSISAEAGAAMPDAPGYVDMAIISKPEFQEIYDTVVSQVPEKVR